MGIQALHDPPDRTHYEELANSITHGLGVLLGVAGLVALVVLAARRGQAVHIVSCSVYGATLILLYLASTLYHALRPGKAKDFFQIMDHSAIFMLIAGTYTPFTLVSMRGAWGWSLFGIVWGLAFIGILFKILSKRRFSGFSIAIYVAMGWLVVVAIKPLFASMPMPGIGWIVAGGLCYTGGLFFYVRGRIPFYHTIWHVAVLAGSAFHYVAVMGYVIPMA